MKMSTKAGMFALSALLAAGWITAVTPCFGEDAPPAVAKDESAGQGLSLVKVMATGGGTMYVIAGLSFLTVFFVVYFGFVLRNVQVAPPILRREVLEKLRAGNLPEAKRVCDQQPCPLSAITLAAVDYVQNAAEPDVAMLKDVIEGEGSRQSEAIQGRAQYLLDIAVIAPMLGLLGTVVGMLQAFNAVALETATAKPVALAAGVSKALVATAFGLMVGIPAMGFYGYFRRKASSVVSFLEVAAIEVMAAIRIEKRR